MDEYSGFYILSPLSVSLNFFWEFRKFLVWFECRFGCAIKRLHSDGGGDYVVMKAFLQEHGIECSLAPPYSPNQNAISEGTNRTIFEAARAMLIHASLPHQFWVEAVRFGPHVRNIFFAPRQGNVTSYEFLLLKTKNASHPHIWCNVWGTHSEIETEEVGHQD